jgi:hypothetical protein
MDYFSFTVSVRLTMVVYVYFRVVSTLFQAICLLWPGT